MVIKLLLGCRSAN